MTNATISSIRPRTILVGILLIILLISVFVWDQLPVADAEAYFNFADQRIIFGIPHFFDVTSNLLFLYVSVFSLLVGLRRMRMIPPRLFAPFMVFNIMIFLTGWTSSYFHFRPVPETLFWDRLPLAMAFSSMLTLVLVDRVVTSFHRLLLVILNMFAFWTVWNIDFGNHDIRPYVLLQFGSLLLAVLLLLGTKPSRLNQRYLWAAFLLYALAKICELNDHQIYDMTGMLASGHTIKHILSAIAVVCVNFSVLLERRKYA